MHDERKDCATSIYSVVGGAVLHTSAEQNKSPCSNHVPPVIVGYDSTMHCYQHKTLEATGGNNVETNGAIFYSICRLICAERTTLWCGNGDIHKLCTIR
jgi:hypothetical protein